jgi:pyruvate/2-oxoglutarate dehydrogenase complex dihydrolipoamide dehydrogenase (E3) component
MRNVLTPDICVIGAGSAGLRAASTAAALGASVVLIEKNRMGGDGLNAGDVPSKALIAAAHQAQASRDAADFGIIVDPPRTDFSAVMEHVRRVISAVEPNDSVERFTGLGVTVLKGAARFIDRQTVTVNDETNVRARRFVIAAGSRADLPPIQNLSSVPYLTNETIFDLKRLPGRLVVIGGGRSGLEIAQAFRRLGSELIVLEAEKVLADDDHELATLLLQSLRSEGIDIREKANVTRVTRRGRSGVRIAVDHGGVVENLDATHLFVATGRRPDLNDLGLLEGRIAFDELGIKVNRRFRTTNRRVYAIGDVTPGPRFSHWAAYQAELVVRSILFRFGGKPRRDILPWVTFTEPELAHVGLSEEEAVRRYRRISILRWPFSENDRAHTDRATRGLVKVIVTKRGRVVGADILGRNAGELIAPFALAVSERMNVKSIANAVFPHPTSSEAARRAAISFSAQKLDSPWTRRLIQMLRKLG